VNLSVQLFADRVARMLPPFLFEEYDPAGASYRHLGICQLLTGPRGGLEAHRFLLTIGDRHSANFGELH
jgi:hypothetical protein